MEFDCFNNGSDRESMSAHPERGTRRKVIKNGRAVDEDYEP